MHRPLPPYSGGYRLPPPAPYDCHRQPHPHYHHHRGRPPSYQQLEPHYPPNYRRDRPPGPLSWTIRPSNFVIQLLSSRSSSKQEIEGLISKLTFKPEKFRVFGNGGSLFYQQWVEALETMVELWEFRLKHNGHFLTPRLKQNVEVSSDKDELTDRLKTLFLGKLRGLLEDELMKKWQKKLEMVLDELREVKLSSKKYQKMRDFEELRKKKDGLVKEGDLIAKRIEEFKNGVQCMVDYLEGKGEEDEQSLGVKVGLFRFGREFDWEKIHCSMMRECRRLDDGLPIFAFRGEILQQIHCQQWAHHQPNSTPPSFFPLNTFLMPAQPHKSSGYDPTALLSHLNQSCNSSLTTQLPYCPNLPKPNSLIPGVFSSPVVRPQPTI